MRSTEPDPSAIRVEDDFEPSFMNDHVVMEPAQDNEIGLIGLATLRPRRQVVDLKTAS